MFPDPRASRAVLVGVDSYTGMPPLPATVAGTRRLAALLRDLWDLPASHVTVLGAEASQDEILSAVRDAARATSDTLVVYFAGHGLRDLEGDNLFLCLAAADPEYPQVGTVAYRELRRVLRTAGAAARCRLTVLDCCFSGLAGAMSPQGVATRDELARTLDEESTPDSDPSEDRGDVVLTSAPHDRQSFVPPGAAYPEATGELISVLERGIPHTGPELSVALAWNRVRKRLRERGSPLPQQFAQNTVADTLCFPNRAAVPPSVSPSSVSPSSAAASEPEPDWQPVPVGPWRPEKEIPYPRPDDASHAKQQLSYRLLLDDAWADLRKDFKTVRRRLKVPFRVRYPLSVVAWLHESTGDPRWTVIAESIKVLEGRTEGYVPSTVMDPYAAQVPGGTSPPSYLLTRETVIAYRERVDQLRADISRLTDLHASPRG